MKPGYWIAIMAILGALTGYAVSSATGWLGTGIGAVLGILVGALIYLLQTREKS